MKNIIFTRFYLCFILCLAVILGTAVFSTTLLSPAYAAGTIYVDDDSTCNSACGGSWATAHPNLQDALTAAQSDDQIWVAEGVYYPDEGSGQTNDDRTATFVLKTAVAVYGGFDGTEDSLDQRTDPAPATVLSGDIDQNDNVDASGVVTDTANIAGSNAYHVVTGSGVDETAVLDHLIITAGQATGTVPHHQGGGMVNDSGSPTLAHVSFIGNTGQLAAGMHNNNGSKPTLTDVVFNANLAFNGSGGGMYNANGSHAILTRVIFVDNYASSSGGGMHNSSSNPVLSEVIFERNRVNGSGGAMINASSQPSLTAVTFIGNIANSNGGGMYNTNSSPTFIDVIFSHNDANFGGGMANLSNSNPILTNATFYFNEANTQGGGIHNSYSAPILTNVTLSTNWAGSHGGGIYNVSSSPILTNVTFAQNHAENFGDGLYNYSGSPKLTNVVIADSFFGQDCKNNTGVSLDASSSHNLMEASGSNACGLTHGIDNNIIGQTPNLGPLQDNGGKTETHALLPDSPAIDAGDNAACPANDQRGRARLQPGDLYCDIGAYERDTFPPQIVSITRADPNPNESAIVDFVVTFSEYVVDLDSNDFSPTTTGTLAGSAVSSVVGSGAVYTVTVDAGTGGGSLRLDMPNTATVTDLSANGLAGVPYTSGETYTILGIKVYLPMILR